jgi:nucleotide-binding universal stress UspA family protein
MNVVVGIDGSDDAFAVFERAINRAREAGDDLTVALVAGVLDDAAATTRRVRETLTDAGIDGTVEHVDGEGELVELADNGRFDRLVVSGGERTPTGKLSFSPTTEFVLMNADTSVTLAR